MTSHEKRLARSRRWKAKNKEKVKASRKTYHEKNRDVSLEQSLEWRRKNRDKVRAYKKTSYQMNPQVRTATILRNRIRKAFKEAGVMRRSNTAALLGCTVEEARRRIEATFQPGMSWENQGLWHIDHIKPLAGFDLSDPVQALAACHYTNLQALWAADNLRKSDK
jgi:hypothetical protein